MASSRSTCRHKAPLHVGVDLPQTVEAFRRHLAQHAGHEGLDGAVDAAAHHRFQVADVARNQDGGDLPAPVPEQPVATGLPFEQEMRRVRDIALPHDGLPRLDGDLAHHGVQQGMRTVEVRARSAGRISRIVGRCRHARNPPVA